MSITDAAARQATQGSPFWRFSLAFYGDGNVAKACLDLQDHCDVDVNLLLFLLWMASVRRALSVDEVRALDARSSRWRSEVVVPLRVMRRRLKTGAPPVDAEQVALFRSRVKAVELESERLQQEALYALSEGLAAETASSREEAARANVRAYEGVKGRAFNQNSVDILLEALKRQ